MANLQYIGARYVPKFYENPDDDSNNWKSGESYEAFTIVTYLDDSYTSKIPVPASIGNPADNHDYWVKTGNFNASITALQAKVQEVSNKLKPFLPNYYVTPEFFGAVGDGITDDGEAIRNAIEYANTNNKKLVFNKNTYLYSYNEPYTINCSIDFNGATIVLNNTSGGSAFAFNVGEEGNELVFSQSMFTDNSQITNSLLFGKSFTVASPVSLGLRNGTGAEAFYTQHIMVDNNGGIVSAPWGVPIVTGNYTCMNIHSLYEEELTIENVTVKSSNTSVTNGNGFMQIKRNNVHIKNVKVDYTDVNNTQYIMAVIQFNFTSNCTLDGVVGVNPYGSTQSGYILNVSDSSNIVVSNFICVDKNGTSWGAIGGESSNDIIYNNCVTRRLDVHTQGTYTANNCILNHATFSGGTGAITFNNCTFDTTSPTSEPAVIHNRQDHQYILNGEININNCRFLSNRNVVLFEVILARSTDIVDPTTVGYNGLKVNVNGGYYRGNLLYRQTIYSETYANGIDMTFNDFIFNSNYMIRGGADNTNNKPINSFKMVNCKNISTGGDTALGMPNYIKNIEFNGCEVINRIIDTRNNSSNISVINCKCKRVMTHTTGVLRILENMITEDIAPSITNTPSKLLMKNNIIIADTDTNESSWNN